MQRLGKFSIHFPAENEFFIEHGYDAGMFGCLQDNIRF